MSGSVALRRALLVMVVALAADQLTKALVRNSIEPGEVVSFLPGVDLVRVANEGIAFGLFDGVSSAVLVAIGVAFTAGLGWFLLRSADRTPILWLPTGLLAGGAIGNLIDRVHEGAVTDFIDPPAWPAFNLADVEITAGVLILAWIYLREPSDNAPGEIASTS